MSDLNKFNYRYKSKKKNSSEEVLFIKTHTRSCTDVLSIVLFSLVTYFNLIHCECLAACSEMLPKLFKSFIHAKEIQYICI